MGFSITWCAVREENADKVVQDLGLTPTGETEEMPESLICIGKLDTGWRVLSHNEYGCPYLQPQDLARLSIDHDLLLCLIEEHVMASSSEFWSKGKRHWRLSHEGEDGPRGLDVEGDPPENYAVIRKEMEALQLAEGGDDAGVDYLFEIPLEVAKSLVGFKHDEICAHLIGGRFEVMSRAAPNPRPLSRLFDRPLARAANARPRQGIRTTKSGGQCATVSPFRCNLRALWIAAGSFAATLRA
jgi:hypothetical protein